ncbi:hypothetical protein Ae201684_016465 [Aphanomyces euteiches]|uniref:Uncharacterized protein n=1 Tax=Aphanomyces euteiches TaxID=100861 RepID=A0A6G0WCR4_9STRA|nr:hypothetical protein Ae201684_016465 [Aphanomyces euteiches]
MDSAFLHEDKSLFDFNDLVMGSMGDAAATVSLDHVLSEDSLDDSSSTSGKKRKYVNRQKLELEYLREKVEALQKQMEILGSMQTNQQQTGSEWKDLAAEQKMQTQMAFLENARLRAALQEELAFAETLAGIVRKKPKVLDLPTTKDLQWREFKLVDDPEDRAVAFSAIPDREYNKVINTLLQRDADTASKKTVKSTTVKYLDDGVVPGIVIESFNRLTFPGVHFHILGFALWSFINGDIGDVTAAPGMSSDTFEKLATLGDNIVYMKSRWRISESLFAESRLLIKRFVEEGRQIVVWRNIIDDSLIPLDPNALTFHGSGWAMVEHDVNSTVIQFFTEISTPLTQVAVVPAPLSPPSDDENDAVVDSQFQVGTFTDSILSAYRNAYRRFENASMRAWSKMQQDQTASLLTNLDAFLQS